MKMQTEELDNEILKINLEGRLDVEGTEEIDLKFSFLTTSKKSKIIVDMEKVSFIASIGMRTLLTASKAQANRGGKIVMLKIQPLVMEALKTVGIDSLIPIVDDMQDALKELNA